MDCNCGHISDWRNGDGFCCTIVSSDCSLAGSSDHRTVPQRNMGTRFYFAFCTPCLRSDCHNHRIWHFTVRNCRHSFSYFRNTAATSAVQKMVRQNINKRKCDAHFTVEQNLAAIIPGGYCVTDCGIVARNDCLHTINTRNHKIFEAFRLSNQECPVSS